MQVCTCQKFNGEKEKFVMKRFILTLCFFLTMLALVVFPIPVIASAPTTANGTLENPVSVVTNMRQADGNMILSEIENAECTGTMAGPYVLEMMVIIHKNGKINMHGISTIDPCTIDGMSGTITMNLTGIGVMTGPETGTIHGQWVFLCGTGDLANVHGQGTFEATAGVGGTYSGKINFDP